MDKGIKKKILEALTVLETGKKYILMPAKVGYTMICWSDKSTESMFFEKHRPLDKRAVFLVNYELLKSLAIIPAKYRKLIQVINEEGLLCSFVLKRKKNKLFQRMPTYTQEMSIDLHDHTSSFAINASFYIDELVKQAHNKNMLLTCSSANASGVGNEGIFQKIPKNIIKHAGYYIEDDAFVLKTYIPKNRDRGPIIRLSNNKIELIREGLMIDELQKIVKKYGKI